MLFNKDRASPLSGTVTPQPHNRHTQTGTHREHRCPKTGQTDTGIGQHDSLQAQTTCRHREHEAQIPNLDFLLVKSLKGEVPLFLFSM